MGIVQYLDKKIEDLNNEGFKVPCVYTDSVVLCDGKSFYLCYDSCLLLLAKSSEIFQNFTLYNEVAVRNPEGVISIHLARSDFDTDNCGEGIVKLLRTFDKNIKNLTDLGKCGIKHNYEFAIVFSRSE